LSLVTVVGVVATATLALLIWIGVAVGGCLIPISLVLTLPIASFPRSTIPLTTFAGAAVVSVIPEIVATLALWLTAFARCTRLVRLAGTTNSAFATANPLALLLAVFGTVASALTRIIYR